MTTGVSGRRAEIGAVASRLGYQFRDPSLLRAALTHRSFGTPHNERLEFLGDSVLGSVIALALYRRHPRLAEGELSRLRANLVRRESLVELATQLDLGDYLRLGEGELRSGGAGRPSIMADALEAVFGAIFLDGGFDAARAVVEDLYGPWLDGPPGETVLKDPKTALQELLQSRRLPLPEYSVLEVSGETHDQRFRVSCQVAAWNQVTEGQGTSRRRAEQEAAGRMLQSAPDA